MSARPVGVPPGRAGRLWLRRRLALARGGVDLLDRKLRLLRRERERVAAEAGEAGSAWREACVRAETWALRAALVGGDDALRASPFAGRAEASVDSATFMGVRFPTAVRYTAPGGPEPDGATARRAAAAAREALDAAARHAAGAATLRILDAEIAATRRRVRAVQNRWIPRLTEALAEIELALEEQEHADGVRMRRFRDRSAGQLAPPSDRSG